MDIRLIVTLALAAGLTTSLAHAEISFSDVTAAANINRAGESYGAAWGDLNGDGLPDIYASNHRQQDDIFVDRGNGTFFKIGPEVLPGATARTPTRTAVRGPISTTTATRTCS